MTYMLNNVLAVYHEHNQQVQADNATLADKYKAVVAVARLLRDAEHGQLFDNCPAMQNKEYWLDQCQYLTRRWNGLDCNLLICVAAHMSKLEDKLLKFKHNQIKGWIKKHCIHVLTNAGETVTDSDRSLVLSQFDAACNNESQWNPETVEIDEQTGILTNARAYYMDRMNDDSTRLYSTLCLIVLSITPSEASVERAFSRLKQHWSPKRNRCGTNTINNLLQIQYNHKSCHAEVQAESNTIPLSMYPILSPLEVEEDSDIDQPDE